jgi:hypothetical protein
MSELLLDCAGRRRSPATMPGFPRRPPGNKGVRYPADPPKVEEILAVMRAAGENSHGRRLRGLMVILCELDCASGKRSLSLRGRSPISAAARWFRGARGRSPQAFPARDLVETRRCVSSAR